MQSRAHGLLGEDGFMTLVIVVVLHVTVLAFLGCGEHFTTSPSANMLLITPERGMLLPPKERASELINTTWGLIFLIHSDPDDVLLP